MRHVKRFLLLGVALALALTAAPAFADRDEGSRGGPRAQHEERFRGDGFRGGHEEREEREEHEEHERREHGGFGYVAPYPYYAEPYAVPYAGPDCYAQDGYWAWNGYQYVWIPPQNVCQ